MKSSYLPRLALIASIFQLVSSLAFASDEAAKWTEIMGPPQAKIPSPGVKPVSWGDDMEKALLEARQSNKPVLVTFRCLPCDQCSEFDADVLDGSAKLTPLLQRFVTVRMTDAKQLDDRYFPYQGYQDLDLSWWGYFLSPEGQVYGVFGGKDHISDTTRISEEAFVNSLERVLEHHYDTRRQKWNVDGALPNTSKKATNPTDNIGYKELAKGNQHLKDQACLHCHQVRDVLNKEEMENGTFEVARFSQPWPFPENLGMVLDRDDGLLVTEVESGGAADKAGIKVGDRLEMAERQRLFGQADFRGVLHRAPYGKGEILVAWTRDGAPMFGRISFEDGWRENDISWRKSVYDGIYGPSFGFFPLKGPRQGKGSMSFKPFMGSGKNLTNNQWYDEGLRPNMEIVSINGRTDDWDTRELLTWFRLNHEPGDTIVLEVKQGGKTQTMKSRAKAPKG